MSPYQIFAARWFRERGDELSARAIESAAPETFAFCDGLMQAAFAMGYLAEREKRATDGAQTDDPPATGAD